MSEGKISGPLGCVYRYRAYTEAALGKPAIDNTIDSEGNQ